MRRRLALLAGICAAGTAAAQLPKMDDLLKGVDKLPKTPVSPLPPGTTDDKTGAAGIKEALAVGTERAVQNLSAKDGYFGNAAVKILMPPKIQKVADVARAAATRSRWTSSCSA